MEYDKKTVFDVLDTRVQVYAGKPQGRVYMDISPNELDAEFASDGYAELYLNKQQALDLADALEQTAGQLS